MIKNEFWQSVLLAVIDKGLLALILLVVGYYLNRVLEVFKGQLSSAQEFNRSANSAIVELTKKLAAGNHLVAWVSWSATEPVNTLSVEDFAAYDKDMIGILSDLVGLQASVAALVPEKFKILSDFAERLADLDIEVGKARDLFRTEQPVDRERCIEILRAVYEASEKFKAELLKAVTGLLKPNLPEAVRG